MNPTTVASFDRLTMSGKQGGRSLCTGLAAVGAVARRLPCIYYCASPAPAQRARAAHSSRYGPPLHTRSPSGPTSSCWSSPRRWSGLSGTTGPAPGSPSSPASGLPRSSSVGFGAPGRRGVEPLHSRGARRTRRRTRAILMVSTLSSKKHGDAAVSLPEERPLRRRDCRAPLAMTVSSIRATLFTRARMTGIPKSGILRPC